MGYMPFFWRYLTVCFLAVMNVFYLMAQAGVQVVEGENYSLGVIPVPGEAYEWKIYSDVLLSVQATPDQVAWISGNTGPTIVVQWKKSGVYYFTVSAAGEGGCLNLKVGMVSVNQLSGITPGIMIAPDKNPICEGTPVTFRTSVVNQGQVPRYTWRKNGNVVGMNAPKYVDANLKSGDVITCQLTSSARLANPVNVHSNRVQMSVLKTKAAFDISESIHQMNWELHFINHSKGANQWDWDFGDGQTSAEENPVIRYRADGTYLIRLISTNDMNCPDTAYYTYIMLFKGLYIPNAFAPTTDVALANTFKPAGTNLKEYKIQVFDSWGHLLWESDKLNESGSPVESWDGKVNGELMPQGTYMWRVTAVFKDGTTWTGSDIGHGKGSNMGTVSLIR